MKEKFPPQRLHTYYFLQDARNTEAVHLNAKIDMTNLFQLRKNMSGPKYSYISYVIKAVSDTLKDYPEANTFIIRGIWGPKIYRCKKQIAKFTIDKKVEGVRAVLSGTVIDVERMDISDIQERVDHYKNKDFCEISEFYPLSMLHRFPYIIGRLIFKILMRIPKKRMDFLGTYSLTSLGHNDIEYIQPIISSTINIGMGTICKNEVVVSGITHEKFIMGITLSFDHRILDGAISSDILMDLKGRLENPKEVG